MTGSGPVRVLVADDQALVRAGLATLLDSQPDLEVVGQAGDGREAIWLARELRPDVVLMDVRMPVLDGLAATRQIMRQAGSKTRVLVLTTLGSDDYVYEALQAGASGFLLKDAPEEQLIEAIRVVARGDAMLAPAVTRRLIDRFVRVFPAVGLTPSASLDRLSDREVEVVRAVARGLSNLEIANELFLSVHTVKAHVAHCLNKLGLRDRVQLVVLAYEQGLVRRGESVAD